MKYDLEDRTFRFAENILKLVNNTSMTLSNRELAKQLIRSGCSVGANYIEANEALSKKDFLYRIKICRKESKETLYWLRLIEPNPKTSELREQLVQESTELTKIFGAILRNSST